MPQKLKNSERYVGEGLTKLCGMPQRAAHANDILPAYHGTSAGFFQASPSNDGVSGGGLGWTRLARDMFEVAIFRIATPR